MSRSTRYSSSLRSRKSRPSVASCSISFARRSVRRPHRPGALLVLRELLQLRVEVGRGSSRALDLVLAVGNAAPQPPCSCSMSAISARRDAISAFASSISGCTARTAPAPPRSSAAGQRVRPAATAAPSPPRPAVASGPRRALCRTRGAAPGCGRGRSTRAAGVDAYRPHARAPRWRR